MIKSLASPDQPINWYWTLHRPGIGPPRVSEKGSDANRIY